jgi:selenocysteine-specific elongation factor
MSVETLRHFLRVPDAIAAAALGAAEQAGRLRLRAGAVATPAFRMVPRASAEEQRRLVAAVREAGLAAPTVTELAERLGLALAGSGLEQAALGGDVVRVEPGRYVAREALEGFATLVREVGAQGDITPGALRDRTGLSRKFLIPLLEWADRSGITYREGEGRRLCRPRPGAARGA